MDREQIAYILRQRREELGKTLQEVESESKISVRFLRAMEEALFPPDPDSPFDEDVYARQFIRTYARYLHIPDERIRNLLALETVEENLIEKDPAVTAPQPKPVELTHQVNPATRKRLAYLLLFASLMVLAYGYTVVTRRKPIEKTDQLPAVPPETVQEMTDTQEVFVEPDVIAHMAEILATGQVWIYIESDGVREEALLNRGDTRTVEFNESIRLRIGRPDAVEVTIAGQAVDVGNFGSIFDRTITISESGQLEFSRPPAAARRFRATQAQESQPENEEIELPVISPEFPQPPPE